MMIRGIDFNQIAKKKQDVLMIIKGTNFAEQVNDTTIKCRLE